MVSESLRNCLFGGQPGRGQLAKNPRQLAQKIAAIMVGSVHPESVARNVRISVTRGIFEPDLKKAILRVASQELKNLPEQEIAERLRVLDELIVTDGAANRIERRGRPGMACATPEAYRKLVDRSSEADTTLAVGLGSNELSNPHTSILRTLMLSRFGLREQPPGGWIDAYAGTVLDKTIAPSNTRYTFLFGDTKSAASFFQDLFQAALQGERQEDATQQRVTRAVAKVTDLESQRLKVYVIPARDAVFPMVLTNVEEPDCCGFAVFAKGDEVSLCEMMGPSLDAWQIRVHLQLKQSMEVADTDNLGAASGRSVARIRLSEQDFIKELFDSLRMSIAIPTPAEK